VPLVLAPAVLALGRWRLICFSSHQRASLQTPPPPGKKKKKGPQKSMGPS